MNAHVHPTLAAILNGAAAANVATARAYAASTICPERSTYEAALRKHDWSHQFSDDGAVYRRGVAELKALREQQARIDPLFRVWDSLCPAQCRGGRSYS